MSRTVVTAVAIFLLVFSAALLGASYVRVRWVSGDYRTLVYMVDGWAGYVRFPSSDVLQEGLRQRPGVGRAQFDFAGGRAGWLQVPVVLRGGRVRSVEVALYLPLVLGILLCGAIWLQGRELRRRQAGGRCLHCGYDLRGSSERCPECGFSCPSGSNARRRS